MSKKLAILNDLDRRLIWLLGLVAFAAILAIVLALCFTANKQFSGCNDALLPAGATASTRVADLI